MPLPLATLVDVLVHALEAADAPRPASIGLILSDDAELAALDARHLGVEGPTDVLSFPLLPPDAYPSHPGATAGDQGSKGEGGGGGAPRVAFVLPPSRRPHLGDIVVSVERAAVQAGEGRGGQTGDVAWDVRDELRLLVAHGTLHVCGWDHAEPAEEAAMRALERRILDETSSPPHRGPPRQGRARRAAGPQVGGASSARPKR